MEFYKHDQFFCCYVIKSAGENAKKVLLSVIWNLMLVEINLSQIRISDSKCEKVCAVCPYLLFIVVILNFIHQFLVLFQLAFLQKKKKSLILGHYRNNEGILIPYIIKGGEGWLGFLDLWSGQKPWWNWYLTPVVNFCEVRRAQLAKSTLITSMGPLGSFEIFSSLFRC